MQDGHAAGRSFSVVDIDDVHLRDLVLGGLGPVLVAFTAAGDPRRDELARCLAELASSSRVRCVLAALERCPTTASLLGSHGDALLLLAGGRLHARVALDQPWGAVRAAVESAIAAGIPPGLPLVFTAPGPRST